MISSTLITHVKQASIQEIGLLTAADWLRSSTEIFFGTQDWRLDQITTACLLRLLCQPANKSCRSVLIYRNCLLLILTY